MNADALGEEPGQSSSKDTLIDLVSDRVIQLLGLAWIAAFAIGVYA